MVDYRSPPITRQYKNYWCVPAATQTMLQPDRKARRTCGTLGSRSLYYQIRKHNRYRYRTNGNDIQGWAWALRYYSEGAVPRPGVRVEDDRHHAAIVEAIDRTGHPVGITVRATGRTPGGARLQGPSRSAADPNKQTILGFYVSGPLGPGSRDPWQVPVPVDGVVPEGLPRYHESAPAR